MEEFLFKRKIIDYIEEDSMKDILVIGIVIALVFFAGHWSRMYLIKSGNEVLDDLKILENKIKNDEMEEIDLAISIKEKWEGIESSWNILSDHQNTDEIQREFEKLIVNYENKEKEESLINITEIKSMIEDTPRGEEFSIVNIL